MPYEICSTTGITLVEAPPANISITRGKAIDFLKSNQGTGHCTAAALQSASPYQVMPELPSQQDSIMAGASRSHGSAGGGSSTDAGKMDACAGLQDDAARQAPACT